MVKKSAHDLTRLDGVKAWLGDAVGDYRWRVRGIILDDNTLLPLPHEPALIAKVVEVTAIEHLKRKAIATPGLDVLADLSGRGYPDVLLTGRAVASRKIAVDVKVARRRQRNKGAPTVTISRITLGPFNTYFRRPTVPIPGVGVAYGEMTWHIDLIVLYDYVDGDVMNVEFLVAETWRVASKQKSSTTRDYIGAMMNIQELRNERGAFVSEAEFHEFWRNYPVSRPPKKDAVVEPESLDPVDLPEGA
jgi:hypothetical protein